jgi:putative redox protein
MTAQIVYLGDLRTQATHLQSQTLIETDAPKDNQEGVKNLVLQIW